MTFVMHYFHQDFVAMLHKCDPLPSVITKNCNELG